MSDLKKLKAVADECERAFEAACSKHYPEGKWGYFRAIDREEHIPSEVQSADEKHLAASREFYSARDGERGFLGKYGA